MATLVPTPASLESQPSLDVPTNGSTAPPSTSLPPPAPPPSAIAESIRAHLRESDDGVESGGEEDRETIKRLEATLSKTKAEKDAFEAQYRSLLGKLTTMRNTLGDKLKQDADELDRREQAINDLRATNEDLGNTVETLKSELIASNEDAEYAHSELETLRVRAFDSQKNTSEEASSREIALRDAQEDLERVRMEREEWEGEAMRERVRREELAGRAGSLEMELSAVKNERNALRMDRDREAESAANLHAVLEEFQAAKERELEDATRELQNELRTSNDSLADYKQRATSAEAKLGVAQNDSEKVFALAKEVKDKTLLIGKLRHEAVILNEHLTEALRRLKKDSNENSVDRRLVSNVLITFLTTPRSDTKRFEMLQLLSSILTWSDNQREQVGLQRASGLSAPGVNTSSARTGRGHARSGKGKGPDDGLGENETFSNLWIEFLLKEASQEGAAPTLPTSPGSPATHARRPSGEWPTTLSPPASASQTRRPSLSSYLSGRSSPSVPEGAE